MSTLRAKTAASVAPENTEQLIEEGATIVRGVSSVFGTRR